MTTFRLKGSVPVCVLMLTCLAVGGCQKNHEKWSNASKDRWLELRSGLKLEMAEQRFNTGDLDQAEAALKEARGLDPNNPKLLTLAGRIALERSQLERAYHLFELAIEQDVTPEQIEEEGKHLHVHEARYYQGIVFQRWQNYEKAHKRYNEAYEIEPDNASYLLASCEMLVELDRIDEAIVILEDKKTYFDQNAGIRAALGHLNSIQGNYDLAADHFKEASLLDPDNIKMQEELAMSQFNAGKYEESVYTVNLITADPTVEVRPDLLRLRAKALFKSNEIEKARQAYLELTRGEHADASDWIRLGELAWSTGDVGGTMTAANKAITMEPNRHEGYLLAGMVWQKRNRLDDALASFDRAAELAPDIAVPLILRGIALQHADQSDAAAEAYLEAMRREPSDRRARQLLEALAAANSGPVTAQVQ